MDRRHVLAGLAGFAAAPAALAQQAQPIPANPQAASPQTDAARGGTFQGGPTSGAGGPMDQAAMQWIQRTMMVGSIALQTSEIALQKSKDDDVKRFAQFEAEEQKTLSEVLRSLIEPGGTATTGAAGAQPQPDQKHSEMVQKLQQARAGEAFDKEYVKGQIEGHQELLQIQESFLRSAGNSGQRELVNVAKLARGHIKEHLVMLQHIQDEL